MYSVTIGGREIALRYTVRELADMEEQIGTMDAFNELIMKGRRRLRNMAAAIRIMGNSALTHDGKKGDLTDDWLLDNMDASQIKTYQIAILGAFSEAFRMEVEENTVRDPVLEEIERKKEPGN